MQRRIANLTLNQMVSDRFSNEYAMYIYKFDGQNYHDLRVFSFKNLFFLNLTMYFGMRFHIEKKQYTSLWYMDRVYASSEATSYSLK